MRFFKRIAHLTDKRGSATRFVNNIFSDRKKGMRVGNFSHLNQSNSDYIENLYQEFLQKPDSVPPEWKLFFEGVEFGEGRETTGLSEIDLKAFRLVQAYRDYGHFEAQLDPLTNHNSKSEELSLQRYGLTEADLKKKFKINGFSGTLEEIIDRVRKIYCGTMSVQIAETKPKIREWFMREMEEGFDKRPLTKEQKVDALKQLIETEVFEKFLHTRFVGAKRFSGEGTDALIPMLFLGTNVATGLGVKEFVIGMAHRGRLNVLTNYLGKGYAEIFGEFEGKMKDDVPGLDGDVKYHLGYSADKKTPSGTLHASLAFNPSHLEAVDPVVLGMTRAKQRIHKDTKERKKVIPILIHGDAAFAGQGIVMETLQQSQLEGYRVGGTLHIVLDNQVGFTADPEDTRSSPYSSDVGKGQLIPVIHVNADDAEACVRAMDMAIRFRQEFSHDVIINMIGYRRYGHNEGDEPAFTQPVMYDLIKKHPTLTEIYGQKLISEKVIDQKYVDTLFTEKMDNLQKILEETKKNPPKRVLFSFEGKWKGLRRGEAKDFEKPTDTRAKIEHLIDAGTILTTVPKNFNINSKLKKLLEQREEMVKGKRPVDWGMAELLSYGTLMLEGTSVRLSGQDCGRGTFSHRHSVFYDQKTGEKYVPLKTIKPEHVEYCVYDSLLSEMGVLGFEYGNSISDPSFLTMWEAQFGDFANGAQIIIDQFISSGETKWYRMNGLVLLLPHGYEGQGPEHSSARLERFLQLCGQENMQVCNLSLPSQIFHVLRRQVKRDFRKPLIIMTPKSLLRHPKVISSLEDLANGTFQEAIFDPSVKDAKKVETAVFCTGKIYYEIDDFREAQKIETDNVAINRIEQLYPFPKSKLAQWFKSATKLKKVIWCQEEPANMGAWPELRTWLADALAEAGKNIDVTYIGRDRRASPAVGSLYKHKEEQIKIVEDLFTSIRKSGSST